MEQTPKILIVEDDASTRARLAFLLRKNGYEVRIAEDGDEGWSLFQADYFPIVLTDWSMPGLSGPELCRLVRAYEGELYTYIILITGKTETSHITLGLEAGADDYVTKPFDSRELIARLRTGRRILDLQASMREAQRKLQDLASRDGLTGVMNRRGLEERLNEAFGYLRRRGTNLSILMLDLDHFKQINDTFGHSTGDDVLREAACRTLSVVREYDTVGRYGGEEFIVVLPEADENEAATIAERIRVAIGGSAIRDYEGRSVSATVSIGISTAGGGFAGTIKDLVAAADAAVYRAKRGGRNRVEGAPSGALMTGSATG